MWFAPQRRTLFWHLDVQTWSENAVFLTCSKENVLYATTAYNFFRHLDVQRWSEHVVLLTCSLGKMLCATTACTFSTSQLPQVVRTWCALYILTWKCASRHNGVHFFDSSTSKSGLNLVCFLHFDLEMCFAPQLCSLFRHLNFHKWSEPLVFWHFWLGNVLRATTACTFSTAQLPQVVRTWCALYILTWKCASCHNSVHLFRHCNFHKWSEHGVLCTFWLGNVLRATTAYTFSTAQLPTVVRTSCAFYILTWKCASRHNCVHFFDISTSKSGPNPWCFDTFDLEMCFAPQRRALFRHRNFKKIPTWGALYIWLGNLLRATTACNFSFLIWPDGSAPAALARLLFDPLEPQIIGKTRDFPTFSRTCIFLLLTFSPLWSSHFFSSPLWLFPPLLFHLSIFSEDVGSLTSKLPSAIYVDTLSESTLSSLQPPVSI